MTPAPTLRAIAERVRTEEASDALEDEVAFALGWQTRSEIWWQPPRSGEWTIARPAFMRSLDAAASAMPDGYTTVVRLLKDGGCIVDAGREGVDTIRIAILSSPHAEPRARLSAALLARAEEVG